MPVVLNFPAAKKRVIGIQAIGPAVDCIVKSVDPARRTLSVRLTREHLTVTGVPVSNDARIVIEGRNATLVDLKPGMFITLQMTANPDASQILGLQAPTKKTIQDKCEGE
jgi:hypothetical protein